MSRCRDSTTESSRLVLAQKRCRERGKSGKSLRSTSEHKLGEMNQLSGIKLLQTAPAIDFSSIDHVLDEIAETRRPKGKSSLVPRQKVDSSVPVVSGQEDEKGGMESTLGGDKKKMQVVCMPYTSDNRVDVVLTALEFVQGRKLGGVEQTSEMKEAVKQERKEMLDDHMDAEISQRNKLAILSNWRKGLMDRLEMNAAESPTNQGGDPGSFDYDGEDVALDLALKEILAE